MALFGVALPVGVLFLVTTMVCSQTVNSPTTTQETTAANSTSGYMTESPSTRQESTVTSTTPGCKDNCEECENDEDKCHCNCTTFPFWIIGGAAGGVVIIVVVVVVVVIICCYRRRGPPRPVKQDFRFSTATDESRYPQAGDFPSDVEAGSVDNFEPTTDDIYGNVDNQGNVIRYNMPYEKERPPASNTSPKPIEQDFGDIYENNIPSGPPAISPSRGPDFGDVYENTPIGNVTQPVTTSLPQPRAAPSIPLRPSPAKKEEDDFGGLYTNEVIHPATNSPLMNRNKFQRHNNQASPESHQAPAVPRKAAPAAPLTVIQHPRFPDVTQRRPSAQQVNLAFQADNPDEDDDVVMPFPTRPAPSPAKIISQSLRLNPVSPPNPGNKFSSLPTHQAAPSHSTEQDDFGDQPLRSPPAPPSQKPKKQTSTNPLKPPTPTTALKPSKALKPTPKKKSKLPPKTQKDRYIDDDNIKGEVAMGAIPVPSDHGDFYEVVESPAQKDYGVNYEVFDIQPKSPLKQDFGLSYEQVDRPTQDSVRPDFGESYEEVEHSDDHREDYELVETPKVNINNRAPMPTPGSAAPPPPLKPHTQAKKSPVRSKPVPNLPSNTPHSSPSHHPGNSGQANSDDEDWGTDYTNVPAPSGGGRKPPSTQRPQPPLPGKLVFPRRGNDFYDDVLAGDDDKDGEDDGVYQNDAPGAAFTPGKHYRNVPVKREQPQRHGNYIQIQGKGH